jgi:hypothetical protein
MAKAFITVPTHNGNETVHVAAILKMRDLTESRPVQGAAPAEDLEGSEIDEAPALEMETVVVGTKIALGHGAACSTTLTQTEVLALINAR